MTTKTGSWVKRHSEDVRRPRKFDDDWRHVLEVFKGTQIIRWHAVEIRSCACVLSNQQLRLYYTERNAWRSDRNNWNTRPIIDNAGRWRLPIVAMGIINYEPYVQEYLMMMRYLCQSREITAVSLSPLGRGGDNTSIVLHILFKLISLNDRSM